MLATKKVLEKKVEDLVRAACRMKWIQEEVGPTALVFKDGMKIAEEIHMDWSATGSIDEYRKVMRYTVEDQCPEAIIIVSETEGMPFGHSVMAEGLAGKQTFITFEAASPIARHEAVFPCIRTLGGVFMGDSGEVSIEAVFGNKLTEGLWKNAN